ncbi:MAG: TadE/TadG family type IV pilus assembly protein [Actinomycetota bacterium]
MGRDECVRERCTRGRSGEGGASAVEFALILPVLILLLFGIVQFGIAYNRTQGLQAAAREGARLASIGSSGNDIGARVRASQSLFDSNDVQIQIGAQKPGATSWESHAFDTWGTQAPCSVAQVGGLVRVTASVPPLDKYAITIPLWGNREITYTASGTFRCERARS